MVDQEREVNLLNRQMELKKENKKEKDDQIQIDLMNSLSNINNNENNDNDHQLLMTQSISKRNLEKVDALDTQQLESLKKLRSMGLYLRNMDQDEATENSTNFTHEDIKHLGNMNDMKNKNRGKTAVKILTGKVNDI